MKIIMVDNLNRDTYDDLLVCENVNTSYSDHIVNMLNTRFSGEHSDVFFKLVEDDYELYKYEW